MAESNVPDDLSNCLKKLRFIATRRAMPEVERLLERFLDEESGQLSEEECSDLLTFLDASDPDIFDWLGEKGEPETSGGKRWIRRFSVYRREVP
ncbi:MAG: succinate dehydrogenase assembly factor 2 [Magnetococcales bacterium]|nr:succinate dehydrogenase assembly factor 2 [Magnetococcales bacterium]